MLVSQKAPDFSTSVIRPNGTVDDEFSLYKEINNRYGVVFFYPFDFTFVCPSELIALHHRMDAFKERDVAVIAVSIDSVHAHRAWRNTPINQGGIGPVDFIMAQDVDHAICQQYQVEHSQVKAATRGTFIIDKNQCVRAELIHDLPIGRNIDEILRVIDAISFHEKHGEVCPAGWQTGQKAMQASPEGVKEYLSENAQEL